jgi:plastocyanin
MLCTVRLLVVVAVRSGLSSVSARAETIQIVIDKLVYVTAESSAKVGDTIEWMNKNILAHTVTATNGDWNVVIAPNRAERVVLKKAGIVHYFCKFHPDMKGTNSRLTIISAGFSFGGGYKLSRYFLRHCLPQLQINQFESCAVRASSSKMFCSAFRLSFRSLALTFP